MAGFMICKFTHGRLSHEFLVAKIKNINAEATAMASIKMNMAYINLYFFICFLVVPYFLFFWLP